MYEALYSRTFYEKKGSPRFRLIIEKIEEKCDLIRQAPYTACHSERLKGNYRGKRSAQLDKRLRIIYMVCEECMKQGDHQWNHKDCSDCVGTPVKCIRFIDITDYH